MNGMESQREKKTRGPTDLCAGLLYYVQLRRIRYKAYVRESLLQQQRVPRGSLETSGTRQFVHDRRHSDAVFLLVIVTVIWLTLIGYSLVLVFVWTPRL